MILRITTSLTSQLLVLAGGTITCHVGVRPLACLTSLLLVLAGGTAACQVCFRQVGGVLAGHISFWVIQGRWEKSPVQRKPMLGCIGEGECYI